MSPVDFGFLYYAVRGAWGTTSPSKSRAYPSGFWWGVGVVQPTLRCTPLQEVLQVHPDSELRGTQLQGGWQPGVSAQHHDGSEEVLQPPVPLPRGCRGGFPALAGSL